MPFDRGLTSAEQILRALAHHLDGKVGYVVFRVTYGDDKKWEQFVERLTGYMHAGLEHETNREVAEALKAVFELDIRDNETELKNASKSEVRAIFRAWVASTNGMFSITKYGACIYADEEVVESVLQGEDPRAGFFDTPYHAYVKILDYQFEDEPYQYDSEEEPDEQVRASLNAGDDGCDPIEGCRSYDVGWVKAAARMLMPWVYAMLSKGEGWDWVYVRPPAISKL
ncbi:uncharacterized protein RHO25_011718 [Cercospora beticola]|uniref:Uncharacterized protein n=1 Tax=Cercospora beticola TaxID=122368 RepID=A0ABZ0P5A8_CERBT|nr:hypothetical protein RHO25_011718 [Cercospora beticola]CAK1367003.1 unnamed protein product [Cercospora beticola]